MNDILKNRVWRLLPKEYKEDVQSHFKDLNNLYHRILSQDSLTNEDCDCCQSIREKRALYRLYFGEDNLTSAIDDSFFQEIYQAFKEKLYNGEFLVAPENPSFIDRFLEYTKVFKWTVDTLTGSNVMAETISIPILAKPISQCHRRKCFLYGY